MYRLGNLYPRKGKNMKRLFLMLYVMLVVGVLFGVQGSYADGNIGITYSQIIDERSGGLTGAYATDLSDRVAFEADGNFQTGDVHNLKLNTDFIFDIATVDLKLLIENRIKGYSLDTLGREQSVGLAFSVPIDAINVDVGIGGKNANPWTLPSAHDTLVAEGFDERDIADKGLESVTPPLKGLPFKEGNTVNAFVSTGFRQGSIDVDIKAVVELLGEGDKQHQIHFSFDKAGDIGKATVTTGLELGFMAYQDAIYYETALVTSVGFDF